MKKKNRLFAFLPFLQNDLSHSPSLLIFDDLTTLRIPNLDSEKDIIKSQGR